MDYIDFHNYRKIRRNKGIETFSRKLLKNMLKLTTLDYMNTSLGQVRTGVISVPRITVETQLKV